MSDEFDLDETDIREVIAGLTVDQIAALNEDVRRLRDEKAPVGDSPDDGDDGSNYEHGEVYDLDSGAEDDSGEDREDPDDSQTYESGGIYDLPSE